MNNFDFMPFDPSNIPGFDPKPHHRPVGPVHPDNIPIHPEQNDQPAQDNSDPTGEDYYSEYGTFLQKPYGSEKSLLFEEILASASMR